jgi:hypothetical protein
MKYLFILQKKINIHKIYQNENKNTAFFTSSLSAIPYCTIDELTLLNFSSIMLHVNAIIIFDL